MSYGGTFGYTAPTLPGRSRSRNDRRILTGITKPLATADTDRLAEQRSIYAAQRAARTTTVANAKQQDSIETIASAGSVFTSVDERDDLAIYVPQHACYHFMIALYLVAMGGAFISALAVPLSTHGNWWWRVHWTVDTFQELSKRYEIVCIVMPLGLGISMVSYLLYLVWGHFWASIRFFLFRDGIDYMLLFDTIVPGVPMFWLAASVCGLTNVTELLLGSFVFMTGHALLSVAEYYGYNNRVCTDATGSGKMTWLLAFLSHVPLLVLLPLDFKNGTRHHSTAAWMVMFFTLTQLVIQHIASFIIVFYHSDVDAKSEKSAPIARGGIFTYFRLDNRTVTDEEAMNWKLHMDCIETWNCIRLATNFICRVVIVISILAGEVFRKRGEVVF